jgi:hypothetical protein
MKSLLPVSAAVLAAFSTHAAVFQYQVTLNGASESPANASAGTGSGTVTYDDAAHSLAISVLFSGLTGTTTASHIHAATATALTGTSGVATTTPTFASFPSGVTSGSFNSTLDLTLASSYNPAYVTASGGTTAAAESALASAMAAGKAYLNIHTTFAAGGEIRGFIVPVPEPAETCAAVGAALGAFALYRRSRRQG